MTATESTAHDEGLNATRERWLRKAADEFRAWIKQVSGLDVPDFHVSMGFSGMRYERGVAAICYKRSQSEDGKNHVFISPTTNDTADILVSLLHEMLHVADDGASGHTGDFAEWATRLGLTAPFTRSEPDIATAAQMMVMAAELGAFPHGKLSTKVIEPATAPVGVGGKVKVTTISTAGNPDHNRWISYRCPHHNRPWRASRSAAAEGAPFCGVRDDAGKPCLTEMVEK